MPKFSYAQLEQLWINAGGPKAVAPVAAAVSEAESGGDSDAQNKTDNNGTQTSWGLWQISDGTHNQPVQGILDPTVNAKAAVAKWRAAGNSFSPDWGTYDSGAYIAYLSPGTAPDPNVPAGTATLTGDTKAAGGSTCVTGTILGFCVLSKEEARWLIGGTLMAAGALLMLPGIIIVAASGLARSGAPAAVNAAAAPLERTPGYGHAIRAARGASQRRTARREGAEQGRIAGERAAARSAARRCARAAAASGGTP